MVYDSANNQVMLFGGWEGGFSPGNHCGDTWIWKDNDWQNVTSIPSPPPLAHASLAYDSNRGVVVLFGGNGALGNYDNTWEWDGSTKTWTHISTSSQPFPSHSAGTAYDSDRKVVILFGGYGDSGILTDTWEYSSTFKWQKKTPIDSPLDGYFARIVYDPFRKVVVHFGGRDGGGPVSETWEY